MIDFWLFLCNVVYECVCVCMLVLSHWGMINFIRPNKKAEDLINLSRIDLRHTIKLKKNVIRFSHRNICFSFLYISLDEQQISLFGHIRLILFVVLICILYLFFLVPFWSHFIFNLPPLLIRKPLPLRAPIRMKCLKDAFLTFRCEC